MNKILPKVFSIVIFALFFATAGVSKAFAAPNLQFNKTTVSVAQNATFELKVNIGVDANTVLGSDAIINYAGADLEVVSITNGGFFPEFNSANNATGRLELHGYTSSTNDSRTGNGELATIVFKAKKGSGSSAVTFSCNGSGNDTNILTTSGQNILACAQTNTTGVSYTGTTNTNTPTPTTPPGSTNTPTPTQKPNGNNAPNCSNLYTNISSAVGTPQQITLTCSGTDAGGYINAAEFVFGDGTTQLVQKNAGSPGSIETTHTYTTIGTLGASCRLRDNDGVFSSIPDSCKKVISIRPGSTPTPTQSRSYGDKGTTTTTGSSGPTPTPTRIVVSIISDTPEPTQSAEGENVEPTLYPEEEGIETDTAASSNRIWWIVGGILAILLAFLLLRRKGPPPPPSGQVPIANV
jgi:hypothetical protein